MTIYPSCFGKYNPVEVLLGRLKWSEVPASGEVVSDLEDLEPDEAAAAAEYKWELGVAWVGQCAICRAFKCSRMPYTDWERKEILEEIIRRQAYRILKVVHSFPELPRCPNFRGTQSGSSLRRWSCAEATAPGRAWRNSFGRCNNINTWTPIFSTQVIVPKINSFGLSRKEVCNFREGLCIETDLVFIC